MSAKIWIAFLLSELGLLSFGGLFYVAGKKAVRYSSDMSKTLPASALGVGMLFLGVILQIISMKYGKKITGFSTEAQQLVNYMGMTCFVIWICASISCISGAMRNRPNSKT